MRLLTKWANGEEIAYRDVNGYRRLACVSDPEESSGLFGLTRLPHRVRQLIRPGDWVIDIGANVGLLTGDMCASVGDGGAVWAIEPVPRNLQRLRELREANQLDQLTILNVAVADKVGTATLKLPAVAGSGWASFTASWLTGGTLDVPTTTLDTLCREAPRAKRLSFIKIDVEGAEPLVLAGAVKTLTTYRPWILCEFNDPVLRDAGSSPEALLDQFDALRYRPALRISPKSYDILLEPVT